MRTVSSLLLLCALTLPLFASAQGAAAPSLFPSDCPKGVSTGDPSETKVFVDGVTTDVPIKDFMARKMFCPNACFSERVTISRTQVNGKEAMQFKIVATNECADKTKLPKDQIPPRGCAAGQTQPKVTVDVPKIAYTLPILGEQVLLAAQTVGPKSRCGAKDITNTVNTVFDKLGTRSPSEIKTAQSDIDALKNSPNTVTPQPDEVKPFPDQPTTVGNPGTTPSTNTASDADTLSKTLREKFGVSPEQARSVAESDPDKVRDMIQRSQSNDAAGAQAIAKELKLNDDVIKNIAQMSPPERPAAEQGSDVAKPPDNLNQNTFDPNETRGGLASQCGLDGLAGNIMYAESRCGKINSNPLSSVQGPFHFLCGTWSAYANSTGNGQYSNCAYRNDPTISTQVMNAKMEQFANQYGTQCTQAGLSLTSCQYAIHVFGETGYKNVFNAYLNSPNDSAYSLCGAALSRDACSNNASIFTNGGTVAGVFGELDRRLGGNTTRIASFQQTSSPVTGFFGGGGSYLADGGPFAGTGFFGLGSNATGYSTPTGYSTNSLTSFLSGFFSSNQGSRTSQPTQVSYQSQPEAVVSLIAQPQVAYTGENIVVSWSSVGMRADRPCITRMVVGSASSTIGTSNEGSIVVTATQRGMMKLAISCAALSGQGIVQTASVTVQ